MEVSTRSRGEDSYDLHVVPNIHVGDGRVPGEEGSEPDLELIHPAIPWSMLKVHEAEYFLHLLEGSLNHEAKALYHMDAFVMALKSITEVLRKDCKGRPGFEDWYDGIIQDLKADPDVSFFIDLRNRSLHQGAKPPVLALDVIFCEDNEENPSVRFLVLVARGRWEAASRRPSGLSPRRGTAARGRGGRTTPRFPPGQQGVEGPCLLLGIPETEAGRDLVPSHRSGPPVHQPTGGDRFRLHGAAGTGPGSGGLNKGPNLAGSHDC